MSSEPSQFSGDDIAALVKDSIDEVLQTEPGYDGKKVRFPGLFTRGRNNCFSCFCLEYVLTLSSPK